MVSAKKELLSKTKLEFYKELKKVQSTFKPTKEIAGFSGSAIVGEKNYPNLKIHNISTEFESNTFLNTSKIVKKDYSEIIKQKARNILSSTEEINRKETEARIKNEIEDIIKSKKAVSFNSVFDKELQFNKVIINKTAGITGSKNQLINLNLTQNAPTSKNIEKYTQNDIKSKEAILNLYKKGINEHQIINLLSLGSFGFNFNKKLVPSRWAISAYDSTIEKELHKKIIEYKIKQKYEIFHHFDKGNNFLIMTIPDYFCAEVIETWDNIVESDYVGFDNKLKKSEPETAGGFYATKIAVMEKLISNKEQGAFISVRIIKDYELPLGVVFVRESVRVAMQKPIFSSTNEKEAVEFIKNKYPSHYKRIINSNLQKEIKKQKKLNQFF